MQLSNTTLYEYSRIYHDQNIYYLSPEINHANACARLRCSELIFPASKNRMSGEEKSPSPIRGRWYSSPRGERCEWAWKSFIPLGGHACVDPHKYTHEEDKEARKRGIERKREGDRTASLVVMQDARRGMRAFRPPSSQESHLTVTPGFHLTPPPLPLFRAIQMASRRRAHFISASYSRPARRRKWKQWDTAVIRYTVCRSRLLTRICIT